MFERDRRLMTRRATDRVTVTCLRGDSTTLWRMRSAARDNLASCSVTETSQGCDVLIVFAKGFSGVPERFPDVAAAMRHSTEMAWRLANQGWTEIDAD